MLVHSSGNGFTIFRLIGAARAKRHPRAVTAVPISGSYSYLQQGDTPAGVVASTSAPRAAAAALPNTSNFTTNLATGLDTTSDLDTNSVGSGIAYPIDPDWRTSNWGAKARTNHSLWEAFHF